MGGAFHAWRVASRHPLPGGALRADAERARPAATASGADALVRASGAQRAAAASAALAVASASATLAVPTPVESLLARLDGTGAGVGAGASRPPSHAPLARLPPPPPPAPPTDDDTAAFALLRAGRGGEVEEMLAAGRLNVHAAEPPERGGRGALSLAVGNGLLTTVRSLLAAGAHPDAEAPGGASVGFFAWDAWLRTPPALGDARRASRALAAALMGALLAAGADANHADGCGRTLLHRAAGYGHDEAALQLLRAGADPARADARGLSPVDAAVAGGHAGVARLLRLWAPTILVEAAAAAFTAEWRGALAAPPAASTAERALLAAGVAPPQALLPAAGAAQHGEPPSSAHELMARYALQATLRARRQQREDAADGGDPARGRPLLLGEYDPLTDAVLAVGEAAPPLPPAGAAAGVGAPPSPNGCAGGKGARDQRRHVAQAYNRQVALRAQADAARDAAAAAADGAGAHSRPRLRLGDFGFGAAAAAEAAAGGSSRGGSSRGGDAAAGGGSSRLLARRRAAGAAVAADAPVYAAAATHAVCGQVYTRRPALASATLTPARVRVGRAVGGGAAPALQLPLAPAALEALLLGATPAAALEAGLATTAAPGSSTPGGDGDAQETWGRQQPGCVEDGVGAGGVGPPPSPRGGYRAWPPHTPPAAPSRGNSTPLWLVDPRTLPPGSSLRHPPRGAESATPSWGGEWGPAPLGRRTPVTEHDALARSVLRDAALAQREAAFAVEEAQAGAARAASRGPARAASARAALRSRGILPHGGEPEGSRAPPPVAAVPLPRTGGAGGGAGAPQWPGEGDDGADAAAADRRRLAFLRDKADAARASAELSIPPRRRGRGALGGLGLVAAWPLHAGGPLPAARQGGGDPGGGGGRRLSDLATLDALQRVAGDAGGLDLYMRLAAATRAERLARREQLIRSGRAADVPPSRDGRYAVGEGGVGLAVAAASQRRQLLDFVAAGAAGPAPTPSAALSARLVARVPSKRAGKGGP